jgi:hypothetical protein
MFKARYAMLGWLTYMLGKLYMKRRARRLKFR